MKKSAQGIDPLLSRAIVGTISEPLVVLDGKLNVLLANPAFYKKFRVKPKDTINKLFYRLGDNQWDIPQLRTLLERIIPRKTTVEGYGVELTFPKLGKKMMLINAREIKYKDGQKKMLLSINDVSTERRLMGQKDTLLKEMRHRIANSLQLIASILILKASSVQSEESKLHLQDAHDRIISIATVQRNLDPTIEGDMVSVIPYLRTLCNSLAKSMIGGRKPITLSVSGASGNVTPDEAISLGLITAELVINSLKHAFPKGQGKVKVEFNAKKSGWDFSVNDDGIGLPTSLLKNKDGLGTSILSSLADQLDAKLVRTSSSKGTNVSLSHVA